MSDRAMRIYLACGVTLGWLGTAALVYAYGWMPVLLTLGAGAMGLVAIGEWMHRYSDGDE